MDKKIFYRVSNVETNQGLWYDFDGTFTGLIHDKFKFCASNVLPMPFDENAVGWLSTTDNIDDLLLWFPIEDIEELEPHGYFLHEYESEDYKEYENHWMVKQDSAKVVRRVNSEEYEEFAKANCRDCDSEVYADELHDVAGQMICDDCFYS